MPTPPLTEKDMRAVVEAYKANGYSKKLAAEAMGMKPGTFDHRFMRAVMAGLDNEIVHSAPAGHQIKGVSTLYNQDGSLRQQWVKTKTDGPSFDEVIEILQGAFDELKGSTPPIPGPAHADADLLNLFALPDLHLGLYAWKEETEANWDLATAQRTIEAAAEKVLGAAPPASLGVILGGGDQLHSDSQDNRTSKSGHALDVDGRFAKVLLATCSLFVRLVELALARHETVIVRVLPGNHDPHTSFALAYFLLAWFRGNDRVQIDADPSLFWWLRHGLVLLGATHGHMAKPNQMPGIMAERRAEDWGQTKFRYCHTFHLHHAQKLMTEGGGVITETHQSPVPKDAWHFGMGYLSGRSLQTITYHKDFGEIARNKVAIV